MKFKIFFKDLEIRSAHLQAVVCGEVIVTLLLPYGYFVIPYINRPSLHL
jgi:hypothetical protein